MPLSSLHHRLEIVVEYVQHSNHFSSIAGFMPDIHGYALKVFAEEGTGVGEIVEIGSYQGKSTCWLALASKRAGREKVTAVDHFLGSPEHQPGAEAEEPLLTTEGTTYNAFMKNIERMGVADYVTPIRAGSEEAAKGWDKPIRLLFIDGDHSYEASKKDFDLWSPFVVSHGIVMFHDVEENVGVTRFYRELLASRPEYVQVLALYGLCAVMKLPPGE